MRVLLVSEGKHEQSGALETLVSRLANVPLQCDQDSVKNPEIHVRPGKGGQISKKAFAWMLHAEQNDYDALVYLIDEDGDRARAPQLDKAQAGALGVKRRALGVAIRTFDAWMLADEKALSSVLGQPIQRQKEPESILDPKGVCERLLKESGRGIRQSEMYTEISKKAKLDNLENRCPRGFAPFAERVRAMADQRTEKTP
ncbi:MAG: DUF4276 family protein [Candidatus Sumerlaeota bacterium]|nr:DUF4276 family protein [Candidatus Sumerlaeota bacterium]